MGGQALVLSLPSWVALGGFAPSWPVSDVESSRGCFLVSLVSAVLALALSCCLVGLCGGGSFLEVTVKFSDWNFSFQLRMREFIWQRIERELQIFVLQQLRLGSILSCAVTTDLILDQP